MIFQIICLIILIVVLVSLVLYRSFSLVDYLYVYVFKKPIFVHFYFKLKKLSAEEEQVVADNFTFYNRLSSRHQQFFQHRLISFINEKNFEGRDGFEITREVELLVGATAVMLTFGMRNFMLKAVSTILIYPKIYFSVLNQAYHKGEFSPRLKVLVFSWEDFLEGFKDSSDHLNLGIHEFIHVLQINSYKSKDLSSSIFTDANKELIGLLVDEKIRKNLLTSGNLREYAFTNRFEFLAVLVEFFIESPEEFKEKFPDFYSKIREMLNFNFAGY